MTAIYHRRFYPHDVEGTIAYVAPDGHGQLDARFARFLSQAGPDSCRRAFVALQRQALRRRAELVPLIEQRAEERGFTFHRLAGGAHEALDIVVTQAWAMIWLYSDESACEQLPAPNATAPELFTYFTDTFALANITDASIEAYLPYYYHAGTELGFGELWTRPLREFLRHDPNDYRAFMPEGFEVHVDPSVMQDVRTWVETQSRQLMLIYGENDPYSAMAYTLPQSDRRQTSSYIAPGGNHLTRLSNLAPEDRDRALRTLERWTGVAIEN